MSFPATFHYQAATVEGIISMSAIDMTCAEHYLWGEECDGWHFLKGDDLSVIRERMPSGTSETRHRHERARQFFYILSGSGTMEIDGEVYRMEAGQGIEVSPGTPHCISNRSDADLHFLVISAPKSHGDRIAMPASTIST